MDLLLLVAQVVLVVLLVVLPLFSAYDKWSGWSPQRKLVAVALAVGISVVAFGQYRRIVQLHDGDLRQAVGNLGLFRGPWYARRVVTPLWEYLASLASGAILVGMAAHSAAKKRWLPAAGYAALFALMLGLMTLIKLGTWAG